ncbi:hypothetical protein ABW20_dc0108866 [Dactylellina cionopaga]|nr:hypothetical protein ABW20_dc0108866 [Dactylellina cionopaga]
MLVQENDNQFTATASVSGHRFISRETPSMDPERPESKGKGKAITCDENEVNETVLQPIVIDGSCLCSLLRYKITIPAEFQKSELYEQLVGFTHCYCQPCKVAVSALTRTSLKLPREMIEWTSKAKLVEPESESPVTSEGSGRRRRSSRSGSISATPIVEACASTSSIEAPKASQDDAAISPILPKHLSQNLNKKVAKLQIKLEAIHQDPEVEKEFLNVGKDSAIGCCCYEQDHRVDPPAPVLDANQRSSLGKSPWAGNTGYHRRIWKRDRGVGGKDGGTGTGSLVVDGCDEFALTTSPSPASLVDTTSRDSPSNTSPRTQSPAAVGETGKGKDKDKSKGKAREGLWSKATAAISSKDKAKTSTLPATEAGSSRSTPEIQPYNPDPPQEECAAIPEPAISGCDVVSSPSAKPSSVSPLEILRWETQLLHQQHAELSHRSCTNPDSEEFDGDPKDNILPIPWPFKEFAITTRDGRTTHRGFCSWCGGSLTYRTSASIHGMVDIHVGSMDDPKTAMEEVGFLREFHCDTAGSIELGTRLQTDAGNKRDGKVISVNECDLDNRPYISNENQEEGVLGSDEEVVESD